MAIDTAAKRWSMLSFGHPQPTSVAVFEPDSTVDADDRTQLLGLYNGFYDTGAAPGGGTIPVFMHHYQQLRRR